MQRILDRPSSQSREAWGPHFWQRFLPRSIPTWVICLLIGGIALCFNLYHLGTPSIWFDEVLSVERARQPLPILWKMIFTTQPNMALYYLILHFWLDFTQLFGLLPTEFIVRFPSAVFAALGSIMLYLFGLRFLDKKTALIATALYLINALQLTYAQETRSYSLQLLLLCISWYALFSAITKQGRARKWWICYAVTAALAIYAHLFSALVLCAQCFAVCCLLLVPTIWRRQARQHILHFIVSTICIGIAIIPMFIASLHGAKTDWLPAPRLNEVIRLFVSFAGGNKLYLAFFVLICASGMILSAVAFLKGKKTGETNDNKILLSYAIHTSSTPPVLSKHAQIQQKLPILLGLVCWCIVPFILSFIVSQGSLHLFSTRYLVVIVAPLLLFVGASVELLPWPRIRVGAMVLLLVSASLSIPLYYRGAQVENWKEVTAWLQQHYQPADGISCYDNAQGCELCIEYYLRAHPDGLTFPQDSPGAFRWVDYDLTNQLPVHPGAAVDLDTLTSYGAKHPRLFFIVGRLANDDSVARAHRAEQWLTTHYHLIDQIVTPTVTIQLFQSSK